MKVSIKTLLIFASMGIISTVVMASCNKEKTTEQATPQSTGQVASQSTEQPAPQTTVTPAPQSTVVVPPDQDLQPSSFEESKRQYFDIGMGSGPSYITWRIGNCLFVPPVRTFACNICGDKDNPTPEGWSGLLITVIPSKIANSKLMDASGYCSNTVVVHGKVLGMSGHGPLIRPLKIQ